MRSCAAFSTRSGNSPALADVLVMKHTPRDHAAMRRFRNESTAPSRSGAKSLGLDAAGRAAFLRARLIGSPVGISFPHTARDYGDADSTKAYSCWASRMISALFPSRSPTTKLKPLTVGSIEMNDVVPSSFLREATALRHLPKSKIAAPS